MSRMEETTTQPVPHPQQVTFADIAQRCGVSKMTVSRALRDEPHRVADKTLAKIKAVAEEMGYDPQYHLSARRLASRKYGQQVINRVITFMLPNKLLTHPYYSSIVSGALEVMLEEHFGLLLSYEKDDMDVVFPEFIGRSEVDGVICFGGSPKYHGALSRLRQQTLFGQRPVVTLNGMLPYSSSVVFDDFSGGYALTAHLLEMGHRHILHCYTEGFDMFDWRLAGCRQAYLDRQLDPETYLHSNIDSLYETLARTGATAIIARYDEHAQRIYDRLRKDGYTVPGDFSLVGYNDTDSVLNDTGENFLTTVRLPLVEMGRQAARLMIQLVMGKVTEITQIKLPVELVVRQSVAPQS